MLNALFISSALVYGLFLLIWVFGLLKKDLSYFDLFWGIGFGLISLVLLFIKDDLFNYQYIIALLVVIWSLRYSLFIWKRNFGKGEDERYLQFRQNTHENKQSLAVKSFYIIYLFQSTSMLLISGGLMVGMSSNIETVPLFTLIPGLLIWVFGFAFEWIADAQLNQFKLKIKNYTGRYEDKPILSDGVWSYSRHPNYFGHACMWWGLAIIIITLPYGWIGILSAIYMSFCLIFLTGKANNEIRMKKRKAYQAYIENTSGFIPWFPKSKATLDVYKVG